MTNLHGFWKSPRKRIVATDHRVQKLTDDQLELAKFYKVDTLSGLVDAQAKHIERLQLKLREAMRNGKKF